MNRASNRPTRALTSMPPDETPAVKPSDRRACKPGQEGAEDARVELRGVYLPPALHAEAKQAIKGWLQRREKEGGTARQK